MTQTTTFAQVADILSDAHKDAYGFRPSRGYIDQCAAMSDAEFSAEWNYLCDQIEESIREDEESKTRAAAAFEDRISQLIFCGAKDRATAIRWLADAHDTGSDWGFLEFHLGLAYGYIEKEMANA